MNIESNEDALDKLYDARIGIVNNVYIGSKNNPADLRIYCDITLFPSGEFTEVPLWGGTMDYLTKFPHGLFNLPRQKQMILILFVKANHENPVAAIPLPYNYDNDDQYKQLFYNIVESVDDLGIYHYSGTRQIMRANGSIETQKRIEETPNNFVNHTLRLEIKYEGSLRKKVITDVDNNLVITITGEDVTIVDKKNQQFIMHSKDSEEYVELIDKAGQTVKMDSTPGTENIKLTAKNGDYITIKNGEVDVNGSNKSFVTYTELNTALSTFLALLNAHTHTGVTTGSGTSGSPATPMTLDISASQSQKAKTG